MVLEVNEVGSAKSPSGAPKWGHFYLQLIDAPGHEKNWGAYLQPMFERWLAGKNAKWDRSLTSQGLVKPGVQLEALRNEARAAFEAGGGKDFGTDSAFSANMAAPLERVGVSEPSKWVTRAAQPYIPHARNLSCLVAWLAFTGRVLMRWARKCPMVSAASFNELLNGCIVALNGATLPDVRTATELLLTELSMPLQHVARAEVSALPSGHSNIMELLRALHLDIDYGAYTLDDARKQHMAMVMRAFDKLAPHEVDILECYYDKPDPETCAYPMLSGNNTRAVFAEQIRHLLRARYDQECSSDFDEEDEEDEDA